ncbi:hypothetical protein GCM10008986_28680 [Salinibacillus aidingensis]|uniref:Uncharacterized protein n=1 Tax=Salinibacillus aidingensis TaxID=237684 RepID=A0ABN1BK51_9BACI
MFVFLLIHITIGLALIYFYGKLPKGITTFAIVFLSMSFIYFGSVFFKSLL